MEFYGWNMVQKSIQFGRNSAGTLNPNWKEGHNQAALFASMSGRRVAFIILRRREGFNSKDSL